MRSPKTLRNRGHPQESRNPTLFLTWEIYFSDDAAWSPVDFATCFARPLRSFQSRGIRLGANWERSSRTKRRGTPKLLRRREKREHKRTRTRSSRTERRRCANKETSERKASDDQSCRFSSRHVSEESRSSLDVLLVALVRFPFSLASSEARD